MKWVGIAIAVLLAFAIVSDMTWFPAWIAARRYNELGLNEEMGYLRVNLDTIRRMKRVDTILLVLDSYKDPYVELTAPKDSAYINALMHSLKHMRLVRGKLDDRTTTDEVVVSGDGLVHLRVRFDPARAPVVSSFLRSDDLGRVVYGIFRAKRIKMRRMWRIGDDGKLVPVP